MGFDHCYRFSVHAAILDTSGDVLLLKQTYGDKRWGLPGGSVEPGETIYEAITRECREELGVDVLVEAFTGLYYHHRFNAQVGIFRCRLPDAPENLIRLSHEHSEHAWFSFSELDEVQRLRIQDALEYRGRIASRVF